MRENEKSIKNKENFLLKLINNDFQNIQNNLNFILDEYNQMKIFYQPPDY